MIKKTYLLVFFLLTTVCIICFVGLSNIFESKNEVCVHLVDYECDVTVISWEFEDVKVNITLLNSGSADAKFTLEIDLFDNETYFWSEQYHIELPASAEETFTKKVQYELLFNKHHANAIEIVCGVFGDDDILIEEYFRERSRQGD